jgi:hypothetical protein
VFIEALDVAATAPAAPVAVPVYTSAPPVTVGPLPLASAIRTIGFAELRPKLASGTTVLST